MYVKKKMELHEYHVLHVIHKIQLKHKTEQWNTCYVVFILWYHEQHESFYFM